MQLSEFRVWNYFSTFAGRMKHILLAIHLLLACAAQGQLKSLTTIVNGDPLSLPVIRQGTGGHVDIAFDDMTHEYHRYVYRVVLCNADWTDNEELFESDYIEGYAERPIDDYEKSFNTVQDYTHYHLRLPNPDTGMKVSGNYKVLIVGDESGDSEEPLAEARFMVLEPLVGISANVTANTDIDFNSKHQQLEFGVRYANLNVVDPDRELTCVVMQNRRRDNMVFKPRHNIQNTGGIEFNHRNELIFAAGAEHHKFELLDIHSPGMNVDHTEWIEPFHHAVLMPDRTGRNYSYTEDHNGAFVLRNEDNEDNETTSDYFIVHFTLESKELVGGEVYVDGDWAAGEDCRMEYNAVAGCYELGVMLKSGYYEYRYIYMPHDSTRGRTDITEGDFHETENEYTIFVYHRAPSGRYDRLVGYATVNSL